MRQKNFSHQDLIGGLLLVCLGLFVSFYSKNNYEIGTLARMDSGFVPYFLGWILVAIGVVILGMAMGRQAALLKISDLKIRPLLCTVASVLFFAFFIERLGLAPTCFIVVVVSSMASPEFKLFTAIKLSLFLAIFSWLVFIVGLEMTLPLINI